jgi:indolepyruvate ferredoxin oxidoreductase beta subunit
MKEKTVDIVICGVGGQGIILASNVLCYAAFLEGYDVKKSEVHGMAQRGGSVITHVRIGHKVFSPLIEPASSDIILAFEKLEALRYIHYLKKNGTAIVNDRRIPPMSVLTGAVQYPENIEARLRRHGKIHYIDAEKYALELGNIRTVNIILMGGLSILLKFKAGSWKKSIAHNVKKKYVELNIAAFNKGASLFKIMSATQ